MKRDEVVKKVTALVEEVREDEQRVAMQFFGDTDNLKAYRHMLGRRKGQRLSLPKRTINRSRGHS